MCAVRWARMSADNPITASVIVTLDKCAIYFRYTGHSHYRINRSKVRDLIILADAKWNISDEKNHPFDNWDDNCILSRTFNL